MTEPAERARSDEKGQGIPRCCSVGAVSHGVVYQAGWLNFQSVSVDLQRRADHRHPVS